MPTTASPKRKVEGPRTANYFDVGIQGRKTGITLDQRERDEYGLESAQGLFSSPSKPSTTQKDVVAKPAIKSADTPPQLQVNKRANSSLKRPATNPRELPDDFQYSKPTSTPPRRRQDGFVPPPHSRSPIKTHLNSPAKRGSIFPSRSSPTHTAPPKRQSISRTLDFSQQEDIQLVTQNDDSLPVARESPQTKPQTRPDFVAARTTVPDKRQKISKAPPAAHQPKSPKQLTSPQANQSRPFALSSSVMSPVRGKKRGLFQRASAVLPTEIDVNEAIRSSEPMAQRGQPYKQSNVKKQLTRAPPISEYSSEDMSKSDRPPVPKEKEQMEAYQDDADQYDDPSPPADDDDNDEVEEDEVVAQLVKEQLSRQTDLQDRWRRVPSTLPESGGLEKDPQLQSRPFLPRHAGEKRKRPIIDRDLHTAQPVSNRLPPPPPIQDTGSFSQPVMSNHLSHSTAFTALDKNSIVHKYIAANGNRKAINSRQPGQRALPLDPKTSFQTSQNSQSENAGVALPSFLRGQELEEFRPDKRGRGRPKGAKNKPKPPSDVVPLEQWEMEIGRIAGGVKQWNPNEPYDDNGEELQSG
ncbi:MAG: hypothetical protein M1814_000087 [Vezdaea aestivalis]|nr:MAG: hypothetical protein M1814_000087 [Vezdaea aestivalis]